MRKIILFAFFLSSCGNTLDPKEQATRDSMHADSIARAMMGEEMKKQMDSTQRADSLFAAKYNKNNYPLFKSFPEIDAEGNSIKNFIPKDWEILDSVSGDLDYDEYRDFAIILQYKDSVRFIDKTDLNHIDTILTQPRMVFVLFSEEDGKGFHLIAQNNSFVPNQNENIQEPYQRMKIKDRMLQLDFKYAMSMSGKSTTGYSYQFMEQEDEFVLMGAHCTESYADDGGVTQLYYNFRHNKIEITTGGNKFNENAKTETKEEKLGDIQRAFAKMKRAGSWEVKKGYWL